MTYLEFINKYKNKVAINDLKQLIFELDGFDYTALVLNYQQQLQNKKRLEYYLKKMISGMPLEYAIKSFSTKNKTYFINPSVLIPRPETLELIEIIKARETNKQIDLIDIGAGSGIIGIELSFYFKGQIYLGEVSPLALKVLKRNAKDLKNILILKSDLLTKFITKHIKGDVIISNPPYIARTELIDKNVLDYEPHLALFVDPPLFFYEQILKQSKSVLNDNGRIYFEINPLFADDLKTLTLSYYPQATMEFLKDLYQKKRFLVIEANNKTV